jgi:hypothetical protein
VAASSFVPNTVVIQAHGRSLGIGTNIGVNACDPPEVTVFDMDTFEVVKCIPVLGPSESPAAHPAAAYIVIDIVWHRVSSTSRSR